MKLPLFLLAATLCISANAKNTEKELTMAVGTYTDTNSYGIYSVRFNQNNASATVLDSVNVNNPSFLAITPDNKFIYSVGEIDQPTACVAALRFDAKTGSFIKINTALVGGQSPCYIAIDDDAVFTANYSSGSLSTFNIAADGSIGEANKVINFFDKGPIKGRQDASHIHCTEVSPDGKYLFVTNLGGDCIYQYELKKDTEGKTKIASVPIHQIKLEAGTGPRHLTFTPNGKNAYLISELAGTVTSFRYDGTTLSNIQTIVADSLKAMGSGDIHVSPDGKFVYASNRLKGDGIVVFSIASNGLLTRVGYQPTGNHPRNFAITPNGKFVLVACRDDNNIEIYKRDKKSGLLKAAGKTLHLPRPVCLKFTH